MSTSKDIFEMLDELNLTASAIRLNELLMGPEINDYSAMQLLREIITPQYIETMNKKYKNNLNFSKLINRSAKVENLKTGDGRRYNDETVQQVLTFKFIPDGLNVGVYGTTGAGKSYFTAALCDEAFRHNFRCK